LFLTEYNGNVKKKPIFPLIILFLFLGPFQAFCSDGFTQKDRELLIALKVKMEEIDKRFEQIDKRFEQIDKRFEQIDKRFEQVDKRIDQLITFLWIVCGIFTAITASTIGFAIWDRRTMIRPFEYKIKEIEEGKIDKVIASLRKLAESDSKLAEILKHYNLF